MKNELTPLLYLLNSYTWGRLVNNMLFMNDEYTLHN